MDSTVLQSDGNYYKQTYGNPMGSHVSPILADIVMEDLESECITRLHFRLIFVFRYVDDILTCMPKSMLEITVRIFNSYYERLQLTYEKYLNNRITFLDI